MRKISKLIYYCRAFVLMAGIYLLMVTNGNAQNVDSSAAAVRQHANTIKLNISSRILYDNAFQFSYERMLKKNQSINVSGGYCEFPLNIALNMSNTAFTGSKDKSGYSIGVDYRFYLASENKHPGPRGVYLAPFINFTQFSGSRGITHTDSNGVHTGRLDTRISFLNVGGEMGYQFFPGKKWVIDAVLFGPAITHYNFHSKVDGNLGDLDLSETAKEVINALVNKFPLLDELSKTGEANSSGSERFWGAGFRYNISIGFRF